MSSSGTESPSARYSLRSLVGVAAVGAAVSAVAAAWMADRSLLTTSVVLGASCVARLVSRPAPTTPYRALSLASSGLARLVVLVTATAASIAMAEAATRWVYRRVTTTANFRGYFTDRWFRTEVRQNHYGHRGAEFDEVKAPGVYRVAVMGDSFTFGNGVPEALRFSNLVGDVVARRGVEVLNFGVPGNNWPDHVSALERRIVRLRPDFVLLQWGTNDVELDEDIKRRPPVVHPVADRDWHEWLLARSALYILLDAKWPALTPWRSAPEVYDAYMVRLYSDPTSEGAVRADALMRRFVAVCRERGVDMGIVLVPEAGVSQGPDYPYQFLHDRVAALCDELDVACRDVRGAFAEVSDPRALWVSPFDSHPSVLANRLIADEVLSAFSARWAPNPPTSR